MRFSDIGVVIFDMDGIFVDLELFIMWVIEVVFKWWGWSVDGFLESVFYGVIWMYIVGWLNVLFLDLVEFIIDLELVVMFYWLYMEELLVLVLGVYEVLFGVMVVLFMVICIFSEWEFLVGFFKWLDLFDLVVKSVCVDDCICSKLDF